MSLACAALLQLAQAAVVMACTTTWRNVMIFSNSQSASPSLIGTYCNILSGKQVVLFGKTQRTIYFGVDHLFWECWQLSACSIISGASLSELSWSRKRIETMNGQTPNIKQWRQELSRGIVEYRSNAFNLRTLYEPWGSVVTVYSRHP
jgi:hypothetical protein